MEKTSKIFVAGHRGLVGSSVYKQLVDQGYSNVLVKTRDELDLIDYTQVERFYQTHLPEYVFVCAAKVGGIAANNNFPADFIHQNLMIQNHLIHLAYKYKVKRLVFLGSSCIYPKFSEQPIKEESLLTGPLEPTNRPYALAKISGIEMCWSYNRQYNTQFTALMPTNLYGKNDNFNLETSHVIPALIRKVYTAKVMNQPNMTAWGTGSPRREFLHVNDLAKAMIHVMRLTQDKYNEILNQPFGPFLNAGTGEDIQIKELITLIRSVVGYKGDIIWDTTKPDGTPRKLLDTSRINRLGWAPTIDLKVGLEEIVTAIENREINLGL